MKNDKFKAIFIGAHPDDIEIGSGGTVSRLVKENWDISFFILADGPILDSDSPEDAEIKSQERKEEAIAAAKELEVDENKVVFLGLPDQSLKSEPNLGGKIRQLCKRIYGTEKPDVDLVITHYSSDSHQDHEAACKGVHAAFRVPILQMNIITSTTDFKPNVFVNISKYMERKKASWNRHLSQHETLMDGHALEKIQENNFAIGKKYGWDFAESFKLVVNQGMDPEKFQGLLQLIDDKNNFEHDVLPYLKNINTSWTNNEVSTLKKLYQEIHLNDPIPIKDNIFNVKWNSIDLDWVTCDQWLKPSLLNEIHVKVDGKALLPETVIPGKKFDFPRDDTIFTLKKYHPIDGFLFQYCKFSDLVVRNIEREPRKDVIFTDHDLIKTENRTVPGGFVAVTVIEDPIDKTFRMILAKRIKKGMANSESSWSTIPRFFHRPFPQDYPEAHGNPLRCLAAEYARELFNIQEPNEQVVQRWAESISKTTWFTGGGISKLTGHFDFALLVVLTNSARESWNIINGLNKDTPWPFDIAIEHENETLKTIPLSKANRENIISELRGITWAGNGLTSIISSLWYLRTVISSLFPSYDVTDVGQLER